MLLPHSEGSTHGFHDYERTLDDRNFNSVAEPAIVNTTPAKQEPLVMEAPRTPPLPVAALAGGITRVDIDDKESVSTAVSVSHMSLESPVVVEGIEEAALNYDIFCLVIDASMPQGDLFSCALVSRAVSEIALRALWSTLLTLRPLWHLLAPPRLAFPERQRANVEYFDKIDGAGLHKDAARWERLVGYARYIQTIDIRFNFLFNDRDAALLQRVLDQHQAIAQSQPLFPVLKNLHLPLTVCPIPSFANLLTPCMHNLTIAIDGKADLSGSMYNLAAAFNFVRDTPSQLCRLCIEKQGYDGFGDAELQLLHAVSRLPHLQQVNLGVCIVPASIVSSLAALPSLTYLQVCTVIEDREQPSLVDTTPSPKKVVSPGLRTLRLMGDSDGLLAVLTGLYAPALDDLRLNVTNVTSISDLLNCIEAASNVVNPNVLRHFSAILGSRSGARPEPGPPESLRQFLRPLTSLQALQYFELASEPFRFALSDEDFADFLRQSKWARLETLKINGISWGDGEPCPSTAILHHIKQSLPSLQILSLPMLRAAALEDATESVFNRACNVAQRHPLWWLRIIGKMDNPTVTTLTRDVQRVFPALKHSSTAGRSQERPRSVCWADPEEPCSPFEAALQHHSQFVFEPRPRKLRESRR